MELRKASILLVAFSTWYNIGCYAPYLPLFASEVLGASYLVIGLLTTIYWALMTPSSTIYGYIVDKYGKPRLILIIAMLSLSVSNFTMIIINDINALILLRIFQGIISAPLVPLTNLLAAYEIGISRGIGLAGSIGAIGFLSGSLLGPLLSSSPLGYRNIFVSAGVILLITSILMMNIRRGEIDSRLEQSPFKISHILSISFSVWLVYLAMSMRQIGATGIWALFPLYLRDLKAEDPIIGLAFAINPASQVIFMRMAAKYAEKWSEEVFISGLFLSSIVFIGYYLASSYWEVLIFQVLLGMSWSALSVGSNVYIIKKVRGEIRATALGLLNTFQSISWIIGSYANGTISEITHNLRTYMFIAFIMTIMAFTIMLINKIKHHFMINRL